MGGPLDEAALFLAKRGVNRTDDTMPNPNGHVMGSQGQPIFRLVISGSGDPKLSAVNSSNQSRRNNFRTRPDSFKFGDLASSGFCEATMFTPATVLSLDITCLFRLLTRAGDTFRLASHGFYEDDFVTPKLFDTGDHSVSVFFV